MMIQVVTNNMKLILMIWMNTKVRETPIRKLRRINNTIKTKYYWCEKACDFIYFYELNRDNKCFI